LLKACSRDGLSAWFVFENAFFFFSSDIWVCLHEHCVHAVGVVLLHSNFSVTVFCSHVHYIKIHEKFNVAAFMCFKTKLCVLAAMKTRQLLVISTVFSLMGFVYARICVVAATIDYFLLL
jgi:hypothetical protein